MQVDARHSSERSLSKRRSRAFELSAPRHAYPSTYRFRGPNNAFGRSRLYCRIAVTRISIRIVGRPSASTPICVQIGARSGMW